jgi:hypothetical protein
VPLEHLAYDEATRAIDRQSTSLDGLRARAGILLAAVSLATSFFGGLALGDGDLSTPAIAFVVVAILSGLAAGVLCVAVLWPRAEWKFNIGAKELLPRLEAADDEASAYRSLALTLEEAYDENEDGLGSLLWRFRLACIALGVEALAWLLAVTLDL